MEASKVVELVDAEAEAFDVVDVEYAKALDAEIPARGGEVEDRLRMDYLLEKVAEEEAEITRVAEFTNRRIDMVKKHGEAEMIRRRNRIQWLKSLIKMHVPPTGHAMEREHGKKSLALPHGTIGYRSTRESVVIVDAEKALRFAKANGLEVSVKETVNKTPLHAYVADTGDCPDPEVCGFTVEPAKETFYVQPKGGEV